MVPPGILLSVNQDDVCVFFYPFKFFLRSFLSQTQWDSDPFVSEILRVPDAYVPVVKFKLGSVSICTHRYIY